MEVKIKKWGNSIGLRIPCKVADALGIEENSVVELTTAEYILTVKPKAAATVSSLDELLDSIPDDFQYPDDIDDFVDSAAVGQELL